ncbi:MAG: aldose 1-epimerase family protein [Clostridia bacterium]|nr:aldose 1-epimerase family protein [Clostridia bacterium]
MITLKNEKIKVEINELGAEIKRMEYCGREYIWRGDKEIWAGSAPILFPICGGLKEDKYIFDGKEYTLPKHGYARTTLFEVESADDSKAVFLHKSNDTTKAVYPFDYELRVIYTLEGTALKIEYKVDNTGDGIMYFSIGSHEAYYTPEGIEDYDVIFDREETLEASALYGSLVTDQTQPILKDSRVLPLYDKYFIIDALVFRNVKSDSCVLRNRKTGKAVKLDFGFAKYFLLWHKHGSPYICLEPWAGIGDILGSDYDFTKKEGIMTLEPGKTYLGEHTITILE